MGLMNTKVTFYAPVEGDDNLFTTTERFGRVVSVNQDDTETDGYLVPIGLAVVVVPVVAGLNRNWYARLGGQTYRVSGLQPLAPYFVFSRVSLEPYEGQLETAVELTIGGDTLTIDGERLTIRDRTN